MNHRRTGQYHPIARARRIRVRARVAALAALALAVMACLGTVPTAHAGWTSVGPPPNAASTAVNPSPELEWDGSLLWMTWNDAGYNVNVSTWDGAAWTALPSPGGGGGSRPTNPSLAHDGTSMFVVWNDGNFMVQMRRWTGSSWTSVATPVDNASINAEPNLIRAADGWFYLTYQDDSRVVQVLRGDGSGSWTAMTSPGSGGAANTYPELAHDGTSLHVTYNHDGSSGTQEVKTWSGSAWTSAGTWVSGVNTVPALETPDGHLLAGRNMPGYDALTSIRLGGTWRSHGMLGTGGGVSHSYPSFTWTGTTLYGTHVDVNGFAQPLRWEGPLPPSALRQFRADGSTQIPQGQWTTDGITTNVRLRFEGTHQVATTNVTPWVEIVPLTSSFSATCGASVAGVTFSGPAVPVASRYAITQFEVPVTGLTNGTEYRWRACLVDASGIVSEWTDTGGTPGFGVASPPRGTIVPASNRAATGVWGHNVAPGCARATASSSEPGAMDEDIALPSEAACTSTLSEDLVSTINDAAAAADEYELTDAPSDLSTATGMTVRVRLRKTNGKTTSVTARIRLADGTQVGTATSHAATTTWTTYEQSFTGLSLTKAQVDGLYLELHQSISGGGASTAAQVSTVNVDLTYVTPTITVGGTALADEAGAIWSQCDGTTANVAISAGGRTPVSTTCNASTGAFSASVPVSGADEVIAVYMNPATAGDRAVAYTRNADTSTAISDVRLVLARSGIQSHSGTALTVASLDLWDSTQDADIPVSSTGTSATVAGAQLVVRSGATFRPTGTVVAPTVRISGAWDAGSHLLEITGGGTGGCDTSVPPAFCDEGTFTAGTGTVRVTSTGTTHVRGNTTFAALDMLPTSGTPVIQPWGTIVAGSLRIGNGTNAVTASTVQNPALTVTGTTTVAAGATLDHAGTGALDLQGAVTIDGTISGAGTGAVTVRAGVGGAGGVDLTGATVEQRLAGSVASFGSTSGTIAWRFHHLRFSNASATAATATLAPGGTGVLHVRGDLTVALGTDTQSTTLQADTNDRIVDVDGSVLIAATGTLAASSSATFTVGGDFTNGGTFTANAGTVTFDDAARQSALTYAAPTSFANVTVATASKQLRFDAVDRTTLTGTLSVNGGACNTLVGLASVTAGTAFQLDVQGSASVTYASITDSAAITAASATNSTDGGGNTGWTIGQGTCAPSISISSSASSIAFGSVGPGSDAIGSVELTVATTNASGYSVTAKDESDTWGLECALCTSGTIADWTGTDTTPTAWAGGTSGYAGLTVRDATGGRLAKWGTGTGTAEGDTVANLYAGLDATASVTLHSAGAATAGDTVLVTYRANPGASTPPGTYDAVVTYTATATP